MQTFLQFLPTLLTVDVMHLRRICVEVIHLPLVYGTRRILIGTGIEVNKLIAICSTHAIMTPDTMLCRILIIMIVQALAPVLRMLPL